MLERSGGHARQGGVRARILFPFAGGLVGGSHVSAMLLAANLDPTEFQPLILLHQGGGALPDELASRGLDWIAAPPGIAGTGSGDIGLRMVARAAFLKGHAVDLVHSNEGLMHVMWGPAARLAGLRSIWHHRGHPQARGLRYLAPLTADRVIAVSRFAAPAPGGWSAAKRTCVIPSPFETGNGLATAEAAAPALRASLGLPPGTMLLGFFAHLADRKRPLVFLEALAVAHRLLAPRPIMGLLFGDVLEPWLDGAVDDAIGRLDLKDSVRRMGFRRPIEPWIAAVDANIVPAVDEPFGRTLIEAMLLGTPVIAARSGGNVEALADGETGLLVTPDDPVAMGAAIARLREPGLARRLADGARADARARFGVRRHVDAVSAVYRELLGS